MLTNRERARLQTFPDDFFFSGGVSDVRKQIGEAVPPLLAKRVAEELRPVLSIV
jgi:DNA (cytosine-5)-methyltransferase 1